MAEPTRQHPTAVVIPRADPLRDRHYTPQTNERYVPNVRIETAPKPVDQTTYYGVGRDAMHAPTRIRQYIGLAIADKLSIMAQNFGVARVPGALIVGMPVGHMNPLSERTNITPGTQTTLGDAVAVNPGASYAPQYAKLIL